MGQPEHVPCEPMANGGRPWVRDQRRRGPLRRTLLDVLVGLWELGRFWTIVAVLLVVAVASALFEAR